MATTKTKTNAATGTATVANPAPAIVLGNNGKHQPVTATALNAWVAAVGGANNVTWGLTAVGKAAVAQAAQPGQYVLPYGYGGKPNGVRPTQINWLLYGMHGQWASAVKAILAQGTNKAAQTAAVLAHTQARHGGAYKHTPATAPVFCLQAYYSLIKLCTGNTQNPCVLLALLNGGGSPCNAKFGSRVTPQFGKAAIALRTKPAS